MVILIVIGATIIVLGLAMVLAPEPFWQLNRWGLKGEGYRTASWPDKSALSNVRLRGAFTVAFGILWLVIPLAM